MWGMKFKGKVSKGSSLFYFIWLYHYLFCLWDVNLSIGTLINGRNSSSFFRSIRYRAFIRCNVLFLRCEVCVVCFYFMMAMVTHFCLYSFNRVVVILFQGFVGHSFVMCFGVIKGYSLVGSIAFFGYVANIFCECFL